MNDAYAIEEPQAAQRELTHQEKMAEAVDLSGQCHEALQELQQRRRRLEEIEEERAKELEAITEARERYGRLTEQISRQVSCSMSGAELLDAKEREGLKENALERLSERRL